MQWSGDRNGGFSTARRTVLPVISDPIYGYKRVNVEAQRRDPHSLLNWIERKIRMRKECPEISWGDWRILDPGTFSGDNGWFLRIVMLTVTLIGISIAAVLIGLIASGIEQRIDELRRGRSVVVESRHTLILGYSPRVFTIISELAIANAVIDQLELG